MKTFDEILSDFGPKLSHREETRPLTLWLPVNMKERYDRLQKISHRRFAKKACEALIALIEAAESKSV